MITFLLKKIFYRERKIKMPIDPDEILLDAENLPQFDVHQFEGRLGKSLSRVPLVVLFSFFIIVGIGFAGRLYFLEINHGESYFIRSEKNNLRKTLILSDRGIIYDRNLVPLAWNVDNKDDPDFSLRAYATTSGVSHILGYVKYPQKDSSGIYYQSNYDSKDGVEKTYEAVLSGKAGEKIVETDALGHIESESTLTPPVNGKNLVLSIDAKVQDEFYKIISATAGTFGYSGGIGMIMDVLSGELLSMVSFPEYSGAVMADGKDATAIKNYLTSSSHPLLNRAIAGLYTTGSIIKPFIATGVLDQKIIDPMKQILSTGSISVPNPYFPDKPSVFRDWKALGWVDLRHAIAMSSDVYFYTVGGGFGDQKGIGIGNILKYTELFGFSTTTGIDLPGESFGTIPSPEWKKENFNGEKWLLGDTYNSAIGQYGFHVTPIEILRGIAAVANGGYLVTPTVALGGNTTPLVHIPVSNSDLQIVREGMRLSATEGTGKNLNLPFINIATKTGTAELGVSKANVNSSVIGFFPYEKPKYAFLVIMERGPVTNTVGGVYIMLQLLDWMHINTPEYLN